MTPHVYRDSEIVELLAAARQLGPEGGLRPAVMETLFGLVACTGLRISEALGLLDADADLRAGVLTIRQSKFGKTRWVPLHPSAIKALARYRIQLARHVCTTPELPFFVGSRGQLLGRPIGDRQVRRIFDALRRRLGWVDRGSHGTPRIHDLRHSFAVRRLVLWHERGEDIDRRMLALATYLGHVKVSNTYWYLTGVPELMGLLGQAFERYASPWENTNE